jgi:pyrroline-5-carboxylate reductase
MRLSFSQRGFRYTVGMNYELGVIGAGNMAEAIVRGVLKSGQLQAGQIIASDPTPQRRELFQNELGVRTAPGNREVAAGSAMLLLSVKPQTCKTILQEISDATPADTLVISIMAGISSKFIESSLGGMRRRVVRTMPNTPMLVGQGMAAIAPGTHATPADLAIVRKLFSAAASVIQVQEQQIDAVTAVSGSGPAYFFFLVEQMIASGIKLGLSPEQARELASKTAMGSATMLVNSTDSPQELRRKVTSPNGTTHAAITTMESQGLPAIIDAAMKACAARSKELGQ